eukprot:SAG31_NODE_2773_length_5114_cov_2.465404_2_plen_35_part_00
MASVDAIPVSTLETGFVQFFAHVFVLVESIALRE